MAATGSSEKKKFQAKRVLTPAEQGAYAVRPLPLGPGFQGAPPAQSTRAEPAHGLGRGPAPASPATPPGEAVKGGSRFHEPTRPRLTPVSLAGLLFLFAAILGLILNAVLPWVWSSTGGAEGGATMLDRSEVGTSYSASGQEIEYVHSLLDWPTIAFVVLIIAGAILLMADLAPTIWGVQRIAQTVALLAATFGAFLLALTGFRWLGIQFVAWSWPPGDSPYFLSAAPYVNLILGLGLLTVSVLSLRRIVRDLPQDEHAGHLDNWAIKGPLIALVVVALTLLLSPLLPYATQGDEIDAVPLGEYHFGLFSQVDDDHALVESGKQLDTARLMLWLTLFFSGLALVLAMWERTVRPSLLTSILAQSFALVAIPLIVGIIFVILFYAGIPSGQGEGFLQQRRSLGFNWVLALGYVAVGIVFALYTMAVTVPFGRRMMEADTGATANGPSRI